MMKMRAPFVTMLFVLVGLVAPSCATTSSGGGTDSNTHWLSACSADADCGSLTCRCGTCTRPCADESACAGLSGRVSCETASCAEASKVCVATCATATDCPHGGAGFSCTNGTCVASPSSETDAAVTACHSDPSVRLVCDATKVAGVPWGSAVTAAAGRGEPPTPAGGVIVPGDYQLVSETIYGNVPPNVTETLPGAETQSVLHIDCDVMNELYRSVPALSGLSAGVDCRRLVPRALGVLEVSGWMTTTGPPVPDSRDEVSYTTKGRDLVLSFLSPYIDGSGLIYGSYTRVDEFAPVGAGTESRVVDQDAGPPSSFPPERDTRCPANPPASGTPCSPDPAPLECEYGGDAWRRCTTLAECALQLDGTFQFQIAPPGACTPPNPPECPPTFAAASLLIAVPGAAVADGGTSGPTCNYAEGACACQPHSTGTGSVCGWLCEPAAPAPSAPSSLSCPPQRPLAGDACPPGLECDYEHLCEPNLFVGPDMICASGHWEALQLFEFCAAF